jgi:hypothetical protein
MLACCSREIESRDKDVLQRGNLFLLCTGGNLDASYFGPSGVWLAGHGREVGREAEIKFPQSANYCSWGNGE